VICPVCGKKVGSWHQSGVHPACARKVQRFETKTPMHPIDRARLNRGTPEAIKAMSQKQRDEILRRINRPREL